MDDVRQNLLTKKVNHSKIFYVAANPKRIHEITFGLVKYAIKIKKKKKTYCFM